MSRKLSLVILRLLAGDSSAIKLSSTKFKCYILSIHHTYCTGNPGTNYKNGREVQGSFGTKKIVRPLRRKLSPTPPIYWG